MALIEYNTECDPTERGIYACRVPMDGFPGLHEDKFLGFFDGRWCYLGNGQFYRGEITGWIGPLQRKMT